jgi:hypothetical protein
LDGDFIAPSGLPLYRRLSTPRPRRVPEDMGLHILKESVKGVEHEYETDLATYTVRRPFGIANEEDLWFASGQLIPDMYEQQADIRQSTSIEVAAQINADGSLFYLHGEAMARHQQPTGVVG